MHPLLPFSAPRHDHRDVVVLLIRVEPPDFIHERLQQGLRGQVAMPPQRFDEPRFSEFLAGLTERFGYAVGVEYQRISREQSAFLHRAIPFLENP